MELLRWVGFPPRKRATRGFAVRVCSFRVYRRQTIPYRMDGRVPHHSTGNRIPYGPDCNQMEWRRSSRLLASRFKSGFWRIFSGVRELQSLVRDRAPLQAQNVADIVLIHSPGRLRALFRPTHDGPLDVPRREFLNEGRDRRIMVAHGRNLAHAFPLHMVQ